MKVLVADPDAPLVAELGEFLKRAGHTVLAVRAGPQALAVWQAERPDLMLLEDEGLPSMAGAEVVRALRHRGARTPVIVWSKDPLEAAIIRGLESGADDYLVKPISLRQVLARMSALLRRLASEPYTAQDLRAIAPEIRVAGWALDLSTRTATTPDRRSAHMTHLETCLLHLLLANAGQVVPRDRLVQACWGYWDEGSANLLKSHLARVRRKLGLGVKGRPAIEVVYGTGYRLVLGKSGS
jgi:DNA-binding response OmpR family regulator